MGDRGWPQLLSTLLRADDLSTEDTAWAMAEIVSGSATPAQIAAFAVALRAKGETPAEIAGLATALLEHAVRVDVPGDAVDVVGTGGDRAHTVNISTMAAVVAGAAGARVVKHGNRAASSQAGAADLLEALGIPLDLDAEAVAQCVAEVGIGFCFAARFHSGLRHTGVPRREMGVPTAFNFLGPLANPAQPTASAVGCFDLRMAPVMAHVFADRNHSVLLVRGEDGLDEFTTAAPTRVWVVSEGTVREVVLDAVDLGLPRSKDGDLRGGDAAFNADVARRVFAGERGPVRDAVLVNAAAALSARDGLAGVDLPDLLRGNIDRAASAIDSGAATELLDRWVQTSQRLAAAQ